MSRVAFLGLGRMGAVMAARLTEAGHEIRVWNRSAEGHRRLAAELAPGVAPPKAAATPAAAVAGAEFVITMLADADALEAVLFGSDGAAGAMTHGSVVCDMGTIGVEAALACARRLHEHGVVFLDAPVSGSVSAARAGSLSAMAGGPVEQVRRIEPVLRAFAAAVRRVGGPGSGQAMKLAVNSVLHMHNAALSEALVLAEHGGVDRVTALDVLAGSAVASPYLGYKRAAFEDPDGQPVAFTVDLMRKDLKLIRAFAAGSAAAVPLADTVSAVCDTVSDAGFGDRDMSFLAEHHRRHPRR
ncbi:NAD(P)-dependent oxidoreductase [Streptomyces flaveolus]|uniref:NAD(P)-dependent oxidoreductase n=1 Tax=Streptomyces flaveolus TaxID=67297 RepID=UPI003409C488